MIVALAALFIAVGGFAFAAITGPDGVIHACYKKRGGALSVVTRGETRPGGARALWWNQLGPTGPKGPKGANGTKGANGQAGVPGGEGKKGDAGTAVAYA